MAKYPISNFYVGKLNICFSASLNPRDPNSFTKEDIKKQILKTRTLINGAVESSWTTLCSLNDWNKNIRYDNIFTLFYRNEDGTYYCLHNNELYTTEGDVFVSDLTPLKSCMPSEGTIFTQDEISASTAKMYFTYLFKKVFPTRSLYDKKDYPLDKLYLANFKLYAGETGKRETPNLASRLTLATSKIKPRKIGYEIDPETGIRREYRYYTVLALYLNAYRYYNINEHRQSGLYELQHDGTKLEIISPLEEVDYFRHRINYDEVDIPHLLRLQRRLNRQVERIERKEQKG